MFKKLLSTVVLIASFFLATPSQVFAAVLSISPTEDTVTVGDTFDAEIILDTEGEDVIGADVIILFDSAKLEVEDAALGTLFGTKVTGGSVSYGKVIFEAVALGSNVFNDSDTYATITFNAIADGDANVDIKYTASGVSTDSNVTANDVSGTDLLSQVDNAIYTIKEATPTASSKKGIGGTTASTSASKKTTTPVSGHTENTIAMLIGGSILLALGLYFKKRSQYPY